MASASDSTTAPARQRGLLPLAALGLPRSGDTPAPAGVVPSHDPLAIIEAEFAALIAQPWPVPAGKEELGIKLCNNSSLASQEAPLRITSPATLLPRPAPLPPLTVAISRRRAIFDAFDGREGPSELPLQPSAYVLEADVDWLGADDFDPDRRRLRGSRDHGSVLGQHHLGGVLSFSLGALALAAVLACHVRLLGSSWFS